MEVPRAMSETGPRIDKLQEEAAGGSVRAKTLLLESQRRQLVQFVSARLDSRVAARLAAADVVQEVLLNAARKLATYLQRRPMPFDVWMQHIAQERIAHIHRDHILLQKRSVCREAASEIFASEAPSRSGRPSSVFVRRERGERVRRPNFHVNGP